MSRDLVRVVTLTDMTRSMTAPLVHINSLETKACPGSVLQSTGDNVNISRRFSDLGQNIVVKGRPVRRTEMELEDNHNLPGFLQALDKVDQSSIPNGEPGERW